MIGTFDVMGYHRTIISMPGVLEANKVVIEKSGNPFDQKYEDIDYRRAIKISGGMMVYTDKKGFYIFDRSAPPFMEPLNSVPVTIRFEYNRITKVLRVFHGSELLKHVQCS